MTTGAGKLPLKLYAIAAPCCLAGRTLDRCSDTRELRAGAHAPIEEDVRP